MSLKAWPTTELRTPIFESCPVALTQASLNWIHQVVSESCFKTTLAQSSLPMPFKTNTFEGQLELVYSLIVITAVHALIKVGCLADKCIFPPKFRRLSSHFWRMTASSKPSTNDSHRKWLDTQHKSERTLGHFKSKHSLLYFRHRYINAKWMLWTDGSIYFFLDNVWGHAKA